MRRAPYYLKEHRISKWLFEAGYNRSYIARDMLKVKYCRLHEILKAPQEHLKVGQIERIAEALELPFDEVIDEIRGVDRRSWAG